MPRTAKPVHQLSNGKWEVRYRDPDGKQKKERFDTSRDANAFHDKVRTQVRDNTYIDPAAGKVTFGQFAREWAETRDWKDTSRQGWPSIYKRLEPHLGSRPLFTIDRLCLEAVQQKLGHRYARSTVTLTMSVAKSIMRAAYVNGRLPTDPTLGLKEPKLRAGEPDGVVRPEDVPTRSEALAILRGTPDRFRAGVALGISGLRIGEVLAVSADRLDLEQRHLVVDRQVQRIGNEQTFTTPKAEKVRTITLPGVAIFELRRHLRDHQGAGVLFRGERGSYPMRRDQFYDSAWKPALKAAGLDDERFVFHSLRHFSASSMLAGGASSPQVAGHLGDTVETVQRVYAHWLRDDRDVPAEVLDRLLESATDASVAAER
jgi:integrase